MQVYTRYKYPTNDKQIPTLLWQTTVATTCTDREVSYKTDIFQTFLY